MTAKQRIAKLEKRKTKGGFTWREFIEGRAKIDPDEWQKFVEEKQKEWERSYDTLADALGITRAEVDKQLEDISNDNKGKNSKT
ncbi:MAG: hypothetical protein Q8L87_15405 [Anaerolineales bacterium]|nr:hypothetical protein [Anaerolineales bacterium]